MTCFHSSLAAQVVAKIVKKIRTYLQAIDSSILAVQITSRLSNDAMALCNLALEEDDQDSSLTIISTRSERRRRLDELVKLATEASENAQNTTASFKEVQQELYKIAATTKNEAFIVEIPIDPARPKTIKRPLKDVGSDLVANLSLLAEFSQLASQLADWCGVMRSQLEKAGESTSAIIPSLDGTDTFAHVQSIRDQWIKIRNETSEYQSVIGDLQARYPDLLPMSTITRKLAIGVDSISVNEKSKFEKRKRGVARAFTMKAPNVIRDGIKHLACHACLIGV